MANYVSEFRTVMFREAPLHNIPGINVLLIVGQKGNEGLAIGSGVIIGPNLAVCARHVIEAFYNELVPREHIFEGKYGFTGNRNPFFKPRFSIIAYLFNEYGSDPISFIVETINCSLSDMVVLKLNPIVAHRFVDVTPSRMQAVPPAAGGFIDAFGYSSESGTSSAHWDIKGYGSRGEIKEVLLNGRDGDNSILFFPIFRTNAYFAGGMSGGPVYSSKGVLCGLICYDTGTNIDDLEAEHVSYATALFPLLGCKVEMDLPYEPLGTAYTLQELCRRKVITMDGYELFRLTPDEDGWVVKIEAVPAQISSRQW